jgi:lipid II:glycine glycyltransferase (peptidoglycan interpeptide bridge formation enzyme)
MGTITKKEWDEFLKNYPNSHILQTNAWGEFKYNFGWRPFYEISGKTGAQILFRKLPLGYSIAYIPKGPVGELTEEFLDQIEKVCQERKAIVLYIEPDAWEDDFNAAPLLTFDFEKSLISIQPRRTILVSLAGEEEEWLERMKQKTRYNVRLAEKKDVVIKRSSGVTVFNQLMKVTGERNVFGIHNDEYYHKVFELFSSESKCELLIAYYQNTPLAGLMVFFKGERAWYFYGASSNLERNRMPAYLLQFEAMRLAKERGCSIYDMWGIPDFDEEVLEKHFTSRNDGLWSIYRFKRGFGGEMKRSAGVYQKVFQKLPYSLYQFIYKLRKRELA